MYLQRIGCVFKKRNRRILLAFVCMRLDVCMRIHGRGALQSIHDVFCIRVYSSENVLLCIIVYFDAFYSQLFPVIPRYSQVFPGIFVLLHIHNHPGKQVYSRLFCVACIRTYFLHIIFYSYTFTGGAHSQSLQASCMTVYSYSFMCIHRL